MCSTSREDAPFPKKDMNHLPTQPFSEGETCETFGLYQRWTLQPHRPTATDRGLPMWMKKIFIPIILYQAGTEHWGPAWLTHAYTHTERDLPACHPSLSERQMTTKSKITPTKVLEFIAKGLQTQGLKGIMYPPSLH